MSKPGQDNMRYEVISQEDKNNGDVLVPIPPILLQKLGWKEGDNVEIGIDENGRYILTKKDK
jgi:antitoxin component of MazEF toxin-antitoxin module